MLTVFVCRKIPLTALHAEESVDKISQLTNLFLLEKMMINEDQDHLELFPGLNLFYYWKTSASLWAEKLSSLPQSSKILIPINWAFHSDTGTDFDFGQVKPEGDLSRLVAVLRSMHKDFAFLIQISPLPFFKDGGLPRFLAKNFLSTLSGHLGAVILEDGTLNKLPSFFDPRIYQGYVKFLTALTLHLKEHNVRAPFWAAESFYFQQDEAFSYFQDRSSTFDSAFSKFISVKREDSEGDEIVHTRDEERAYKEEFHNVIRELYTNALKEYLGTSYEGVRNLLVMGGSPSNFTSGLSNVEISEKELFSALELAVTKQMLPISSLLPRLTRSSLFSKAISNQVEFSYLDSLFFPTLVDTDEGLSFTPYAQVAVLLHEEFIAREKHRTWDKLSLFPFLKENFHGETLLISEVDSLWHKDDFNQELLLFVPGHKMNRQLFQKMVKHFLGGGRVVFDKKGLSEEFSRKLELFILENSLELQKVNYKVVIDHVQLHEGRLLAFDSAPLESLTHDEQIRFWKSLLDTLELSRPQVKVSGPLSYFWKSRITGVNELSYEQVRRVTFYNPTRDALNAKISLPKSFVLIKVVDAEAASVKQTGTIVDIDFMPSGSLSLDFGLVQ